MWWRDTSADREREENSEIRRVTPPIETADDVVIAVESLRDFRTAAAAASLLRVE